MGAIGITGGVAVWQEAMLVFDLYSNSDKLRAITGFLLKDLAGNVLLPSIFYTPKGDKRRNLLNILIGLGGDADLTGRSWRRGEDFGVDELGRDMTDIALSPYKVAGENKISSSFTILRNPAYVNLRQKLLVRGQLTSEVDRLRFVLFLKRKIQQEVRDIIFEKKFESLNNLFVDSAFKVKPKNNHPIFCKNINTGEEELLSSQTVEGGLAIDNPADSELNLSPIVYILRVEADGVEKFYYLAPNFVSKLEKQELVA